MFTRQLDLGTCGIIIDYLKKAESGPKWSTKKAHGESSNSRYFGKLLTLDAIRSTSARD